jgi:hypothetical protein
MGWGVSHDPPDVAPELGTPDPIFRPFFAWLADIRKVIYTTSAVESLNMSLRKVIKTRGSFPNQEAAFKLLYLALEHIAKKWTMPVQNWKAALATLRHSARRARSESRAGVIHSRKKKSEEEHSGMGLCPKPRDLTLSRQDS